MKINIIGGGPAGLYFAILMKRSESRHQITIYERNSADDTFGWGVVFSGKTLANLRAADEVSHSEITRNFASWDNVDIVHGPAKISIHGNNFSGISRIQLLHILQRRCEALGIELRFRTEVIDTDSLMEDCDLLIAADGVNSATRLRYQSDLGTTLSSGQNRYIWYGTHKLFHGLTLTFRQNEAGVFAAHSYKFNNDTSTFIVECDEETWNTAGFAAKNEEETRLYLEKVFAQDLTGEQLLSNNSKWINFLLVKNATWYLDKVVLLGDALHTAHFSIGSGTKLAMEDAIALHQCLAGEEKLSTALCSFELKRKPIIEEYQAAALDSMRWFENAREYMHLPALELAYTIMTRSGRVDDHELRKRDPVFMEKYDSIRSK